MKKSLPLLTCFILAFSFICHPLFAAKPKKKAAPADYTTEIKSVSATSITVKEPKAVKIYKIDKFTQILNNGKTAQVSDLQPGMLVEITVGSDPGLAERISVSGALAPSKNR